MRLNVLIGALISPVIFFGGAEFLARAVVDPLDHQRQAGGLYQKETETGAVVFPRFFDFDRELLWKYAAGLKFPLKEISTGKEFLFTTNQDGLRDDLPVPAPPDDGAAFTLLSLGDSCAAGMEVELNYTKRLALRIAREHPGRRVQGKSGGTSGYTSEEGARQLDQWLKTKPSPDLVVIHFGHNDASRALGGVKERGLTVLTLYGFKLRRWLSKSYFASWLNARVHGSQAQLTPPSRGPRVEPAEYRENLERMLERLKDTHARVVLINSIKPLPEDSRPLAQKVMDDAQSLKPYNEILRDVAAEYKVGVIDLSDLIRRVGNKRFFNDLDNDTIHPSPEGHELIAGAIYAEVFRP